MVGHLNLVSAAFGILFIGLGVDFAIHLGMAYASGVRSGLGHDRALHEAGASVGGSLLVCTLTTAIGFFVFGLIFMPLIVRFVVAAPLGTLISPLQSIRVMARDAVFAILFPLAAMLPLMAVHYALGIGAIFVAGDATKWVMLGLDSVVTAWLALVMICAQHVIATHPAPLPGAPQRQRAAAGTIAE